MQLYRSNLLLHIVRLEAPATPDTLAEVVQAVEKGSHSTLFTVKNAIVNPGTLRLIFVKKGGAQERTMLSSQVDSDAL